MENTPEKFFWTSREDERPAYTVQTPGGFYHLTYENTVVRRFDVEEGEFDYVVHVAPDDSNLLIFLKHNAILNKYLQDKDYPTYVFSELDETTITYYANMEASQLDDLPDAA